MTDQELQRLCRKWQKRLRLQDWVIQALFSAEMEDWGMVFSDGSDLSAVMHINPAMPPDQIEPTVVHELLHVRLRPFEDQGEVYVKPPNHDERETAINLLASCFIDIAPKRARKLDDK